MTTDRPDLEVVADARPGSFTLRVDGTDQSHVDLEDPRWLEFGYIQRFAEVLDLAAPQGDPLRLVHVGGGAMTLPRYVAATRPGSRQVVMEPDEALTALVREKLPLPRRSGITVRPVDGRRGLTDVKDGYADALVLDAFAGAVVPADLVSAEAFAEVARVLVPGGLLLANLVDRAPFAWVRRALASVESALPAVAVTAETAVLKGRRHGNVLAVATTDSARLAHLVAALRRGAAASPVPYRTLDPAQTRSTLGGGTAFTDATAEPSPPPPHGRTTFG